MRPVVFPYKQQAYRPAVFFCFPIFGTGNAKVSALHKTKRRRMIMETANIIYQKIFHFFQKTIALSEKRDIIQHRKCNRLHIGRKGR